MLLAHIDPTDPCIPLRHLLALFLDLILETPRAHEHLVIRSHGAFGVADDLHGAKAAHRLAAGHDGGGGFERGVGEAGQRLVAGHVPGEQVDLGLERPGRRGDGDLLRRRHCGVRHNDGGCHEEGRDGTEMCGGWGGLSWWRMLGQTCNGAAILLKLKDGGEEGDEDSVCRCRWRWRWRWRWR